MNITYNDVILWCEKLTSSWKKKDMIEILSIFSEIKLYYEDPFSNPGTNEEDIKKFWEEIEYQNINFLKLFPIAIEKNVAIVRWCLNYNDIRTNEIYNMDGIYEVIFNSNKKCEKFTQWWVVQE